MKRFFSVSLLVLGCGDGIDAVTPDAASSPDPTPDAAVSFVPPTPVAVRLSPAGNDQLLAAVSSGNGFYAVGWRTATHESTADRELVVVKMNGMGALDHQFGGGDGIASLNVQTGGNAEVFRGIVVQPSGKIVVSGVVEDETVATDRDIALVRFNTDGTPDTTFGTAGTGIVRLDLNTALNGTMAPDTTWGLAQDSAGKLFVHAGQRTATLDGNGADTLTDTDFVVVKLGVDGAVATAWASQGKFTLDIQRSNASVRGITVLADGSVLGYGYAKSPSLGSGSEVQPVVYKLTPAGALDSNFASGGLFHEVVLATQTEVYGIAVQPDGKLVTAGYGRNDPAGANDWISLRLTAAGALDTSWANQGKYLLDPTGMNLADNCRNAIALPGGRTALVGSAGPSNMTSDAYVVVLDETGKPDAEFGTGIMKFDLGSNDALFGGAVATQGMRAMFVGYKGGGMTPSAATNDDSYVISLSLDD
jgi:uncharacterized delta-60 repeat protein